MMWLTQARALAYTTSVSLVLGGAAIAAMQHTLQARDVTEVASLADAIALAKRQRVSAGLNHLTLLLS